jgi:hypothetical protein
LRKAKVLVANFSETLTTKLAVGDLDTDSRSEPSCDVVVAEGDDAIERAAAEWRAIEDAGGVASNRDDDRAARD